MYAKTGGWVTLFYMKKTKVQIKPTVSVDPWIDAVKRYQAGRAVAEVIATSDSSPTPAQLFELQIGSDAAAELALGLIGLPMEKIRHESVLRREPGWFSRNIDDLRGDAIEWLLITLEKFKPGEGTVTAYIASRTSWLASDLLFEYSQDGGKLDYSWYKIRSASASCAARLRESYGRAPSNKELAAALLEEARTELTLRYLDRSPDLVNNPDELSRRVQDRLSRDGIFAAVRQLDAILELGASDIRLDANVGEDGDSTLGERISSNFNVEAVVFSGSNMLEDLYAVALGDSQWARATLAGRFGVLDDVEGTAALPGIRRGGSDSDRRELTIPRLAELTGYDKVDIRKVLSAVGARLSAPHVQFAHLSSITMENNGKEGLSVYTRQDFVDIQ